MFKKIENDKSNKPDTPNAQDPSQQAIKNFAIKLVELNNKLESRGENDDRVA